MPSPGVPPTTFKETHPLARRIWGRIHYYLVYVSRLYCHLTKTPYPSLGGVWPLPFGLFMKWSDGTREEETHAMRVARALGIPCPRVISYGDQPNGSPGSILMTRMPGKTLGEVYKTLTPSQIKEIQADIRKHLDTMRNWQNPYGTQICSVSGQSIRSARVPFGYVGPCSDEAEFHTTLLRTASPLAWDYPMTFEEALVEAERVPNSHSIVFTHGDLWHHNILVHNGRLSAILDWEAAGWYPEYWEFTTVQRFQRPGSWWTKFVQGLGSDKYSRELVHERALWLLTQGSF